MVHPLFILDLYKQYNDKKWPKYHSSKICQISYARIQGLDNLIEHFRKKQVYVNSVSFLWEK